MVILFEERSGGRCRCRRHLFLRHLFLHSVPHTLFSPRQHGAVQARASIATARPGTALDHDQGRRGQALEAQQAAPIRARSRSRGGRLWAPGAGAGTGLPRRTCWADYYNPVFLQQGSFIRGAEEGAGTALMRARQIILK